MTSGHAWTQTRGEGGGGERERGGGGVREEEEEEMGKGMIKERRGREERKGEKENDRRG